MGEASAGLAEVLEGRGDLAAEDQAVSRGAALVVIAVAETEAAETGAVGTGAAETEGDGGGSPARESGPPGPGGTPTDPSTAVRLARIVPPPRVYDGGGLEALPPSPGGLRSDGRALTPSVSFHPHTGQDFACAAIL